MRVKFSLSYNTEYTASGAPNQIAARTPVDLRKSGRWKLSWKQNDEMMSSKLSFALQKPRLAQAVVIILLYVLVKNLSGDGREKVERRVSLGGSRQE